MRGDLSLEGSERCLAEATDAFCYASACLLVSYRTLARILVGSSSARSALAPSGVRRTVASLFDSLAFHPCDPCGAAVGSTTQASTDLLERRRCRPQQKNRSVRRGRHTSTAVPQSVSLARAATQPQTTKKTAARRWRRAAPPPRPPRTAPRAASESKRRAARRRRSAAARRRRKLGRGAAPTNHQKRRRRTHP